MRYRIKRVKEGCIDGSVFFDDIIELEKIDEPEEKTLEEKIQNAHRMPFIAETYAQIAKEHYQKHPEEIHEGFWEEFAVIANKRLNLVSLDKVLEVFDEAKKSLVMIGYNTEISFIRKALEQLKEKE